MASAVIMNSEQSGTYLLLSNKYAALEQHLDNNKDARKNSKARTLQNRIKLQGEKKKNDNVLVVEKQSSELGEKSKPTMQGKGKGKGKKITAPTTIYYGDAGRGFGSRIHGQERRSTDRLQMALYSKLNTKLINTNEYLSSKLCCLCDSRDQHPKRRNGRANLGVKAWILTSWSRCKCCH
ncbi:hypothetical protein BC941DRAFT_442473 [Chlamydoabsidia padenii]|nr:hypothetical protein BC941DRAFT_442473 [Chlamydoabsidia padenii]